MLNDIRLNNKDLQSILEALLFSLSCDVSLEWDKNDIDNAFEIVKKIKEQNKNLNVEKAFVHNPYLANENFIMDKYTNDIIEMYPSILKENLV